MSSLQEAIAKEIDNSFWPYAAPPYAAQVTERLLALPELQAIRKALYQMIHHIDSEWGHETDDLLAEWAEVFGLPDNVLAWIRP